MMYELVIKQGEVVDPLLGLHARRDIGISQGKIAAIEPDIATGEAQRVIDARGKIVTPGLIDAHAHVAGGVTRLGVDPDECGVQVGVTTVCDGGSTGYTNFLPFKNFVIPRAQTDVFCYLHLAPTGLAFTPELGSWYGVDLKAMLRTIEENRNLIKGIKLRAVETVVENLGLEAVRTAKKVASEAGLGIMVHIGVDPDKMGRTEELAAFMRGLLSLMDKGDILCHLYTWRPGGVFESDGRPLPELLEARERGVILDASPGMNNFSFELAKKALEQGVIPDTVGTDLSVNTINGPVFSLPVVMSYFLALGLSLEQVIAMTTINPARALDEDQRRGSLKVGMGADVSVLEMVEGDFLFSDGKGGNTLRGEWLLEPRLTLKSGVEVIPKPRGPVSQA